MFGQGSFINSASATPEEIARKRAEIAAMMPRFGNARYVGEGLGQLFMGIGLGRQQKALDGQEREGRASAQERLNAVMGGGLQGRAQPGGFSVLGPMPAPTEAQSVADDTMSALGKTPMRPFRDAIASIESAGSGDYGAVGPTHPKLGRALGRYQIMEANIGPWSREVLGREVTPEEFMANPQLQDAIFDGKFGGYVQQFGPEGAAQAWFAGPGGVGKLDRQDSLGTSVADYTAKFSNALGSSPQMAAATIPTDALMSIVMDQWQPPEVRAQAQAMLDQQMKMNDPAYTMGLRADELAIQKAEAELAQMGQPQTPETLTERQALAAAGGLQPGTPEYQAFMLTGNLPGQSGDLPADFRSLQLRAEAAGLQPGTPEYQAFMQQGAGGGAPAAFIALDMQAQAAGFAPGTPEYQEFMATRGAGLSAEAATRGKAVAEADLAAPADISSAETTLSYITSLRDHPGRAAGSGASSWMGGIPGTDAREFQIEVERLKAGAFLTAIDQLKGMGALSNAEGQTATAAVAALDPNGTEEGFLKRLAEYEEIVNRGLERARKRLKPAEDGAQKTRLRFNPATQAFEPIQ